MLEKARMKMASGKYPFVKAVHQMDAHHMTFEDATFDCVVAQFVITLVANPEQVLCECHRVVKPGGRIILVNHLYSEVGVAAAVERWAAQKTRSLGLRPEFRSPGSKHGRNQTKAPPSLSGVKLRLSASIRWFVSNELSLRRPPDASSRCHTILISARPWKDRL